MRAGDAVMYRGVNRRHGKSNPIPTDGLRTSSSIGSMQMGLLQTGLRPRRGWESDRKGRAKLIAA